MNWGTKLMIGMALFMCFIVALGIIMFNSKTDALVDNDYYEKGLNYDQEYNSKEQVKIDRASPKLNLQPGSILLQFKSPASGAVRLMRIADKKMDKNVRFHTSAENEIVISTSSLAKGRWKLIINWVAEGKNYLYEKEINLQ